MHIIEAFSFTAYIILGANAATANITADISTEAVPIPESKMQNNSVFEKDSCRSPKSSAFSVLVVDDDSLIRTLSKMILSMNGMEVQLAENGKEAVDLHLAGASFNLILMDMDMPVMNGPQATKELRDMGIESPIVGVTCHGPGPMVNAFVAAGLTECVQKPLTIAKIAAYLPEFVNKKN